MRVLICPDSFKGSLSASQAAAAIAAGVQQVWPEAECRCIPMADGGEGTASVLCAAWGGDWQTTEVPSPRGLPVIAGWGWDSAQRRAVIEVASACGLSLTPPALRVPWQMDTRGVGMLLDAVLAHGARSIWVGLGGSGTNDAGAGMMYALGARFIDADGQSLMPTPAALAAAVAVDWRGVPATLRQVDWQVLTDVSARLTGAQGATRCFGPQKGVLPGDFPMFDARLQQISQLLAPLAVEQPGDGAAGGLGFAFRAVLGATLSSGSAQVASALDLPAAIASADLVVTGEGRFDVSSMQGKVVGAVHHWAVAAGKPLWILVGQADRQRAIQWSRDGVVVASMVPDLASEVDSLSAPAEHLAALAVRVCRLQQGLM